MNRVNSKDKYILGWMGTVCLLLILPTKLLRYVVEADLPLIIGIAPSILGPAGLLFLLLSSTGRLSRLTPMRAALIAAIVSVALEFLQLIPRPGILARVRYTFDPLDLLASLSSVLVAYLVVRALTRRSDQG